MSSQTIGEQYDEIAGWWNEYHQDSNYGVAQVQRALSYTKKPQTALDIGCGSGGRLMRCLEVRGLEVTGIDVSKEMVRLAQSNHPQSNLIQADIETWDTETRFDFILAWDSLLHLPLCSQEQVLSKICGLLNPDGVLIHSFGDAVGDERLDDWKGQKFSYSSIGIAKNLEILRENGLTSLHLELDQFPEPHVYSIAVKAIR